MSASKKSGTKSAPTKKGAAKPAASHPSWFEMIKDCIVSHPEDARTGVSRPQIKKHVEKKYKIVFTPTTTSQLNRALVNGNEKGTLVFKKGLSGRVSLPRKDGSAAKENKPIAKAPAKPSAKSRAAAKTKAKPTKPAAKPVAKKAPAKASASKSNSKTKKATPTNKKPTTAKKAVPKSSVKKSSSKSGTSKRTASKA